MEKPIIGMPLIKGMAEVCQLSSHPGVYVCVQRAAAAGMDRLIALPVRDMCMFM
jgi:hypothetical protein